MTRKGKIVGESVLIDSLLIKSLPLAFLFFKCALPIGASSAVTNESKSGVKCFLIDIGFVAFNKFFLTIKVFSAL